MKTPKRQCTSIALIPLVLIMLVSIEKKIGAAPDQNRKRPTTDHTSDEEKWT